MSRLSRPLVRAREAALNRALGVRGCTAVEPAATGADHAAITADLRRALHALRMSTISADGQHVDYAALRVSAEYRGYRYSILPRLAAFDPSLLASRAERLAFWINLYNALVIDSVIAFGVQRSVTEGWLGVLSFFRRASYNIAGQCTSCDDIEHGVLRANRGNPFMPGPQFAPGDARERWAIWPIDPRIHFALNCASRSCPPIGVYQSERIEQQLDLAARGFIDQTSHLEPGRRALRLSPIFKWYARDFGGRHGVLEFLRMHLPDDERCAWLHANGDSARLTYDRYDWRLNT